MSGLIFVPKTNTQGLKDATGAFHPEAIAFQKLHPGVITFFDNTKPLAARFKEVLKRIEHAGPLTWVAFFCHGWASGIQAGVSKANVKKFVAALASTPDAGQDRTKLTVILYCCSTGKDLEDDPYQAPGVPQSTARAGVNGNKPAPGAYRPIDTAFGEGSFADKLRDELCLKGYSNCHVVAHTVAAHTTRNPYVIYFDGNSSNFGGSGGLMPFHTKSKLWPKWKKALQSTDLRLRFPFMTIAQIEAELIK